MNIAIVTGATSGLGRAFLDEWRKARMYFDEVWLVARSEKDLNDLAKILPWSCRVFALDLSQKAARDELALALKEEKPIIRYMVNSAGYGKIGQFVSGQRDEQVGMVELNCAALVDLTYLTLPFMQRNSVLFEIASVAAFAPQPGFAVYAATKAFVLSFSRSLNSEMRTKGIKVVAVCPNPMATKFFDRAGASPSSFKMLGFENPDAVARTAMKRASQGRDVSVHSPVAKAIRLFAKAVPYQAFEGVQRYFMK